MGKRAPVLVVLLVLVSLGVQTVFLAAPAQRGLPLDDGWIHATYARNLARHGQLALNPGQPSTGTTSFLWTVLLAASRLAGIGPVLAPTLLNVVLQACLIVLCFLLARAATGDRHTALLVAASCALLGNLVWISLSGMESTLFVAMGLGAIWCHARGRLLAAGILAGLLVLTRPEGAALPLAMALLELGALRRRQRLGGRWTAWARLFGPVAVAGAIYVTVNLVTTGQLLTSTFAGRRWLANQRAEVDLGPLAIGGRLANYAAAWTLYLYRWVFGFCLLAWLGLGAAAVAGTTVGIAVTLAAGIGLASLLERRGGEGRARSPARLLLLWTLVHNAAYIVLLPVHGHAGRYQAINFVMLALLVVTGLRQLARAQGSVRRLAQVALVLWLSLCVGSAALWRTIYRDCVDHIAAVHVPCGHWIAERLPADAVVATYDLGAIAYFAERRIVDLGGLVDPNMARSLFAGDAVPYMRKKGATHLALVQRAPDDLHLAERLGLVPPAPGRPALSPLYHWGIPRRRYYLHHPATSNAMPRITLYELHWPDGTDTEPRANRDAPEQE